MYTLIAHMWQYYSKPSDKSKLLLNDFINTYLLSSSIGISRASMSPMCRKRLMMWLNNWDGQIPPSNYNAELSSGVHQQHSAVVNIIVFYFKTFLVEIIRNVDIFSNLIVQSKVRRCWSPPSAVYCAALYILNIISNCKAGV